MGFDETYFWCRQLKWVLNMDLSDLLSGQEIELECPGCGKSFSVPAEKAMNPGFNVCCPNCHEAISFEQDSSIDDAKQATKDFEKKLKRMGYE
jgi:hypothetical protein